MIAEGEREIAARPYASRLTLYLTLATKAFTISLRTLRGKSRKRGIVLRRHKIICFLRIATGASWGRLSALFNKNQTTIIFACRKYEAQIAPLIGGLAIIYPCFPRAKS